MVIEEERRANPVRDQDDRIISDDDFMNLHSLLLPPGSILGRSAIDWCYDDTAADVVLSTAEPSDG